MHGNQTALTKRLNPSRRQFFQWHRVEQLPIRVVKERMDELTKALQFADYDYDFIAEAGKWKDRSRQWNTSWKVQKYQKGQDLPLPTELADVPVWIKWDQDVGDWRNNKSKEDDRSEVSMTRVQEHSITDHHTGHGNELSQQSTMIPTHESLAWSFSPPMAPPDVFDEHMWGSNAWCHNFPTATIAPTANMLPPDASRTDQRHSRVETEDERDTGYEWK